MTFNEITCTQETPSPKSRKQCLHLAPVMPANPSHRNLLIGPGLPGASFAAFSKSAHTSSSAPSSASIPSSSVEFARSSCRATPNVIGGAGEGRMGGGGGGEVGRVARGGGCGEEGGSGVDVWGVGGAGILSARALVNSLLLGGGSGGGVEGVRTGKREGRAASSERGGGGGGVPNKEYPKETCTRFLLEHSRQKFVASARCPATDPFAAVHAGLRTLHCNRTRSVTEPCLTG